MSFPTLTEAKFPLPISQPGHEYTKANVKFAASVSSRPAIKELQAFADKNKQTQGKFTIADEKKHNVFMMTSVRLPCSAPTKFLLS